MIKLHTAAADYYLLDDGMIYDSPDCAVMFGSPENFLRWHTVTAITSEDGYKFTVTADCVTNGDMSFDNLESAIKELQA